MDKRKEANIRVKKSIPRTLLQLLEQKSISEISISEIVSGAGVARASFYRNYASKENVITTLIADILERYKLYIYIGSLYNTTMIWLQSGQKESVDEIADMFYQTGVIYNK